jgi:hypothetical protein
MKKVRWRVTYDADDKEFDNSTYHCKDDDVWLTTEIPIAIKKSSK